MKFIHLILCLSVFIYCVWGAPRRRVRTLLHPISVSEANIPRHLPGTRKAIPATPQAKAKQRPGPKPKPLEDQVYKAKGLIRRVKRSYSREKKVEVLMFLIHHRIQWRLSLMLRMMKPNTDLLHKLKLANGSKSLSDLLRIGGCTVLRLWAKKWDHDGNQLDGGLCTYYSLEHYSIDRYQSKQTPRSCI